jgi:hypothetical protein
MVLRRASMAGMHDDASEIVIPVESQVQHRQVQAC